MPLGPPPAGAGFTLFSFTDFFQTVSGRPSFTNLAQCQQCNRQLVGETGNDGCDAGFYCNEAALCAPCDNAVYCGPSCSPCGGATPVCVEAGGQFSCAGASGGTGGAGGGASSSSAGGPGGGVSSSSAAGTGGVASSSAGGTGGVASSSSAGGTGSRGVVRNSGCACSMAGADRARSTPLAALAALALAALARARRRRAG